MSDPIKDIFYKNYSSLCNYASAFVKDPMEAEDIVQNLFIQLWQSGKLQQIEHTERFLLKATKFKCIDYHRTVKTTQPIPTDEVLKGVHSPKSDINEEDIEPLFHYFASKLPPKTRVVFLKSREGGMTYKEIAEEMDISVKTVEAQMSRALKQMRQLLIQYDFLSLLFFL